MSTDELIPESPHSPSDSLVVQQTMFEVPEKSGWLWKRSVGKSFFGRKNWKTRFVTVTLEGIQYYATEPFDTPKGSITWDTVTHVYQSVDKDIDADANDRSKCYFGIRFMVAPNCEKLLLLRCDHDQERQQWVEHFLAMKAEAERIQMMVDDDDEDDEMAGPKSKAARRTFATTRGTLLEAIAVKLRGLVSLKKKRYQRDGIDLDLAYITPQLIAMGYPAEGNEAVYRNPMGDVVNFFDRYHKGAFKVYNLCAERSYPPSRFGGNFTRYPFDDHNAPPLDLLLPMCEDIEDFLVGREYASTMATAPADRLKEISESKRVVSVHCKAGKGRTGIVLCCFLIYSGQCKTPQEALKFFGDKRTKDGKGVQIPSQKRYLEYFHQLLTVYAGICPPSTNIQLNEIILHTCPRFDPDGGCDPYLIVEERKEGHHHVHLGTHEGAFKKQMETIYDSREGHQVKHIQKVDNYAIPIMRQFSGELRFTLYDEDSMSSDDKMCSFWIHTSFLPLDGTLTIEKGMLDDAVKDKKDELFTKDFAVTLHYKCISGTTTMKKASPLAVRRTQPRPSMIQTHAPVLASTTTTTVKSAPPPTQDMAIDQDLLDTL